MMRKKIAIKFLKVILMIFPLAIGLQSVVSAQSFEDKYGKELAAVPYDIKVSYMNKTGGKPWSDATYQERYDYLYNRHQKQLAEDMDKMLKDSDRQIQEANKKMEKEMKKQAELQKKYDRDLKKMNQKIYEQNKKNAQYLKSMDQKQRLLLLRQAAAAQHQ